MVCWSSILVYYVCCDVNSRDQIQLAKNGLQTCWKAGRSHDKCCGITNVAGRTHEALNRKVGLQIHITKNDRGIVDYGLDNGFVGGGFVASQSKNENGISLKTKLVLVEQHRKGVSKLNSTYEGISERGDMMKEARNQISVTDVGRKKHFSQSNSIPGLLPIFPWRGSTDGCDSMFPVHYLVRGTIGFEFENARKNVYDIEKVWSRNGRRDFDRNMTKLITRTMRGYDDKGVHHEEYDEVDIPYDHYDGESPTRRKSPRIHMRRRTNDFTYLYSEFTLKTFLREVKTYLKNPLKKNLSIFLASMYNILKEQRHWMGPQMLEICPEVYVHYMMLEILANTVTLNPDIHYLLLDDTEYYMKEDMVKHLLRVVEGDLEYIQKFTQGDTTRGISKYHKYGFSDSKYFDFDSKSDIYIGESEWKKSDSYILQEIVKSGEKLEANVNWSNTDELNQWKLQIVKLVSRIQDYEVWWKRNFGNFEGVTKSDDGDELVHVQKRFSEIERRLGVGKENSLIVKKSPVESDGIVTYEPYRQIKDGECTLIDNEGTTIWERSIYPPSLYRRELMNWRLPICPLLRKPTRGIEEPRTYIRHYEIENLKMFLSSIGVEDEANLYNISKSPLNTSLEAFKKIVDKQIQQMDANANKLIKREMDTKKEGHKEEMTREKNTRRTFAVSTLEDATRPSDPTRQRPPSDSTTPTVDIVLTICGYEDLTYLLHTKLTSDFKRANTRLIVYDICGKIKYLKEHSDILTEAYHASPDEAKFMLRKLIEFIQIMSTGSMNNITQIIGEISMLLDHIEKQIVALCIWEMMELWWNDENMVGDGNNAPGGTLLSDLLLSFDGTTAETYGLSENWDNSRFIWQNYDSSSDDEKPFEFPPRVDPFSPNLPNERTEIILDSSLSEEVSQAVYLVLFYHAYKYYHEIADLTFFIQADYYEHVSPKGFGGDGNPYPLKTLKHYVGIQNIWRKDEENQDEENMSLGSFDYLTLSRRHSVPLRTSLLLNDDQDPGGLNHWEGMFSSSDSEHKSAPNVFVASDIWRVANSEEVKPTEEQIRILIMMLFAQYTDEELNRLLRGSRPINGRGNAHSTMMEGMNARTMEGIDDARMDARMVLETISQDGKEIFEEWLRGLAFVTGKKIPAIFDRPTIFGTGNVLNLPCRACKVKWYNFFIDNGNKNGKQNWNKINNLRCSNNIIKCSNDQLELFASELFGKVFSKIKMDSGGMHDIQFPTIPYFSDTCLYPFDDHNAGEIHRLETLKSPVLRKKGITKKNCGRQVYSLEKLWFIVFQERYNQHYHDFGSYDYNQPVLSKRLLKQFPKSWYKSVTENFHREETYNRLFSVWNVVEKGRSRGRSRSRAKGGRSYYSSYSSSTRGRSRREEKPVENIHHPVVENIQQENILNVLHEEEDEVLEVRGRKPVLIDPGERDSTTQNSVKRLVVHNTSGLEHDKSSHKTFVSLRVDLQGETLGSSKTDGEASHGEELVGSHRSLCYIIEHFSYLLFHPETKPYRESYIPKTGNRIYYFDMLMRRNGIEPAVDMFIGQNGIEPAVDMFIRRNGIEPAGDSNGNKLTKQNGNKLTKQSGNKLTEQKNKHQDQLSMEKDVASYNTTRYDYKYNTNNYNSNYTYLASHLIPHGAFSRPRYFDPKLPLGIRLLNMGMYVLGGIFDPYVYNMAHRSNPKNTDTQNLAEFNQLFLKTQIGDGVKVKHETSARSMPINAAVEPIYDEVKGKRI